MPAYTPQSSVLDEQGERGIIGAIVEFIEIDLRSRGGPVFRITNRYNTENPDGITYWTPEDGGTPLAWYPAPFEGKGFTWTTDVSPRPLVAFGDPDGVLLTASFEYKDLAGVNIKRWTTEVKHLASNVYRGPETWLILRKTMADSRGIEFELGTPWDRTNKKLPARIIRKKDFPGVGRFNQQG